MNALAIDGAYVIYPEGSEPEAILIRHGKIVTHVEGHMHETFEASHDSRKHLTAMCRDPEGLPEADPDVAIAVCDLLGVDHQTHGIGRPWITQKTITIYRDDVWSGSGTLDTDGQIVDCAAVLGDDQDESEQTYQAIEDAIEEKNDSVQTVNGTYTWLIRETRV